MDDIDYKKLDEEKIAAFSDPDKKMAYVHKSKELVQLLLEGLDSRAKAQTEADRLLAEEVLTKTMLEIVTFFRDNIGEEHYKKILRSVPEVARQKLETLKNIH